MESLDYHDLTKHSVARIQTNRHVLDWENQPLPFKIYPTLEALALPRNFERPEPSAGAPPDLQGLARLLQFTAGITRTKVYPGGQEQYFRAAACTGALYHIDVYAVCGALADLEAGVYHFGPHDFALRRLRRGDHRQIIVEASGDEPATARAPILLVCASTFWRNAWKYQSRTYRHCFWDNGTMLANLLAVAEPANIPTEIVMGFADAPVNQLLGLDTRREVALSCVAVGQTDAPVPPAPPLTPLTYETVPLSRHEIDYPAITVAHAASSLSTPEDARQWRRNAFTRSLPGPAGALVALASATTTAPISIAHVIARRGSTRRFVRAPIPYQVLAHILRAAVVDIPADFSPGASKSEAATGLLNDLYLIVNAVDGLAPGAYVYRGDRNALEVLALGDFRREAGHLDLGQALAADASVNFYALSDLPLVIDHFGNRGYRAAALEAAVIGGRIYLAAYSVGLGATGLTFFDDEVTQFFSPHAAGKAVMFLTAVGHSQRRP